MKDPQLAVRSTRLTPTLHADAIVVPIQTPKGKPTLPKLANTSDTVRKALDALVTRYHGATKPGSIEALVLPKGDAVARVAIVSLGEAEKPTATDLRIAAGAAMGWASRNQIKTLAVAVDALNDPAPWIEASVLAAFRYNRLRSKRPENNLNGEVHTLALATGASSTSKLDATIKTTVALAESVNLARMLAHEPPNVINPKTLAQRVQAIARQHGISCKVFDERQLKARKMGAFLAVGEGSASKPHMIVLEYSGGGKRAKPVVFVGKAVTLDTGGYSIKPAESIPEMKYDKCGGMAVIGALVAAARLKLKRNVIGIIGAAENMISGEAYRPGDIVTASNGTTIEVMNTDAEGRLVLADCLHYAEKTYKPAAMIDLATLTGACNVALGAACGGLFANNDDLAAALIGAGERTDERLWRLPLWPVYREQINGIDADIKNVGGRPAGAITAAMFLKEFVTDATPWAHLDIAGVAFSDKASAYCPVGATGFGVRLLVDYLQSTRT